MNTIWKNKVKMLFADQEEKHTRISLDCNFIHYTQEYNMSFQWLKSKRKLVLKPFLPYRMNVKFSSRL